MAQTMRYRREAAISVALAVLTVLVFSPALDDEFLRAFDDQLYVTGNEHVLGGLSWRNLGWAFATDEAANWHPLTWVSLQADATLFGPGPRGFHRTNVLLHAANGVLLFLALRRLTGAVWPSAMAAALFALHPLRAESVAWVSERKDVLSGFFWILALLAYAWYAERPGWRRYLPVLAAFALGLMAKPMVVTLPCVLLLLDYWPLKRFDKPAPSASEGAKTPPRSRSGLVALGAGRVLEKLPLFALAAASGVVTTLVQRSAVSSLGRLPLGVRLANALVAYATYLGKTVWPLHLGAMYPYPVQGVPAWQWAGAAALLAAITLLVFLARRRHPYLIVGWLWFLGTLVPVIGLVQVGRQALADRYTYLPSIGLAIMAVGGAAGLAARWRVTPVAALLGAGTLVLAGALTWIQTLVWHDDETLWEHTLEATGPPNAWAHIRLAQALAERGEFAEAARHYADAARDDPFNSEVQSQVGLFLLRTGEVGKAVSHLERAARLVPGDADSHNALATGYFAQNRIADVISQGGEALTINPNSAGAYYNLGCARARLGEDDEAVACFRRVLELDPASAEARCALAHVLTRRGQSGAAADEYREASRLSPRWTADYDRAAWFLASHPDPARRNGPRAVELAEMACEATAGQDPRLLKTLAAAYAEAGRWDRAEETARAALRLAASAGPKELVPVLEEHIRRYQAREALPAGGSA
jgi:tetratricopeptide (TPR) repeat protein